MNEKKIVKIVFSVIGFVSSIAAGTFLYSKFSSPPLTNLYCRDCNVIIIGFDALQAKRVRHLGYWRDATPTLDGLARRGISFSKHYSVSSWTVPSFMSYFTSRYPSQHRVVNKFTIFTEEKQEVSNLKKLAPGVLTLAQAFKEKGYITGGFTGDAGVNAMFGYNEGFDAYTDERTFGSIARSAGHALQWLDENQGKKFFMFLHGYDAHGQFSELPENYTSRYASPNHDRFDISAKAQQQLREKGLFEGKLALSKEEVEAWNAWYDGKIRDADERIGDFLQEIERRGLLKNTVIIVISDHGTEMFEHQRTDHGFSLYNELIRVPLIIVWPERNIGKIIPTQVSSLDLLPTIFDIVGIKKDGIWQKQIQGESLLPVITAAGTNNRPVFSETDYRNYTHQRSYISPDEWKIIVTMERGKVELYDLTSDPGENLNLAEKEPGRQGVMEKVLFSHMESIGEKPSGPWQVGCLPVYNDQCIDLRR